MADDAPDAPGVRPHEARPAAPPEGGQPAAAPPTEGQVPGDHPPVGEPSRGQRAQGEPVEGQPAEGQPATAPPVAGQPAQGQPAGRVIGTDDATPLEYWVAIGDDQFLQLDDVVATDRALPDGQRVALYGMVEQVRARHEGAQFDSDVFLIEEGVLPAQVSRAAKVATTRVEPEVFVPPLPGAPVRKAVADERARALLFDKMERTLPAGLSRDDEPYHLDLDFLDGTRGAHVNISGVSGVATKTTYAMFLLYSLFHSGQLGAATANTKALVFNVKGEDLLFLDHANASPGFDDDERRRYAALGLRPGPFASVGIVAPPRPGDPNATPQVGSRTTGVAPVFWTLEEFCHQRLLPFLFADAEDDRQQYTMVVHNVARRLERATPTGHGGVVVDGVSCTTFGDLVELIDARLNDEDPAEVARWAGRAIGGGTVGAFVRRLFGAVDHVEHLIRGDVERRSARPVDLDANQVTVVDIHGLNDRAKRFVVGVVLRQAFQAKEASGVAEPLQFVVLDELNKYAPREGTSPIKELLLDIAERGRSLGVILIGAQQTASEVERRVVANSAIRVVGRLDSAEAGRGEYGWLPQVQRQRSTIIKPGTMIVSQPQLPVPVVVEFPFPAWATRVAETGSGPPRASSPRGRAASTVATSGPAAGEPRPDESHRDEARLDHRDPSERDAAERGGDEADAEERDAGRPDRNVDPERAGTPDRNVDPERDGDPDRNGAPDRDGAPDRNGAPDRFAPRDDEELFDL